MKEEFKINSEMEPSERTALKKKLETFDDILPYVGDFGKYQWYLLFALFPFCITYANLYFSTFFLTLVPQEHWCRVPELQGVNLTMDERVRLSIPSSSKYPYYDKCNRKDLNFTELLEKNNLTAAAWQTEKLIPCDHWEYNKSVVPYDSVGSELDWVCTREYLISTAQVIFFLGSILGAFLFGWLADNRGRVPALVVCNIVGFLATIATAWTNSFTTFALCRFISGLAYENCINIPLILVVEYMSVHRRTFVFNIAFGIHFAIGSTLLPWAAYYIANWRHLAYVVSVPMAIGIFTPWILPESARWYASHGKWDKVVENLKRIAKANGKSPDPRIYDIYVRNASNATKLDESASMLDLLKTPRLIKIIILTTAFWTFTIICFDGHVYSLKLLQSSVFVSFSLASATELPAGLLVTLILDRWGRRFCGFLTAAGISACSFAELYLPSTGGKLASSVLARFSANMAANIGLQYATELLPTPIRAQGVALVHVFGIIGHTVSPFIVDLAAIWEGFPMMLVGVLSLGTSVLVLFLPETRGRRLPQTLEEGANFGKNDSFWSLPCCGKPRDEESSAHNSHSR
ncbi:solute carrier family 22 member 3 [Fopius arisanus]|uniref:Solute carrier family 22 member 3 n=1 Tax=Fopius arisanus TaxID=64838 RepID=A0A9R1TA74_9HYME|nr:PREDICTED: solute carrier family 22 member 3-like [Fopius arisanus]XP_011305807.1 PREDICTED: solute carrier family 22 member 3-like [Fopius arisanus]